MTGATTPIPGGTAMCARSTPPLSWALVIATYKRHDVLRETLAAALSQTRPPSEIIIVDASPDWRVHRDAILGELSPARAGVRWDYVRAQVGSTAWQRNQGVRLATADVLFVLDDDSIMYEDCAEQVMRVYEADARGLVAGVQAVLAQPPPGFRDRAGAGVEQVRRRGRWLLDGDGRAARFVREEVFLLRADKMFVPYDGRFPSRRLPAGLGGLPVAVVPVFHGCRMTFRRQPVLLEQFEPILRYASVEDLDTSYRVGRHGLLLEARAARLYHHKAASGRLSRFGSVAKSVVDLAACLRKHSTNIARDERRFRWFVGRRIVVEAMKDACSLRWTLPQCRGVIYAARKSRRVFASTVAELDRWYPDFQQQELTRA